MKKLTNFSDNNGRSRGFVSTVGGRINGFNDIAEQVSNKAALKLCRSGIV